MHKCKNFFLISFILLIANIIYGQTNPNVYWSAIGTGANGPIPRGAIVSSMNSSGNVCIAGEVEINGEYFIRVAIIGESQSQVLGQWLQDPVFASVGAVAWANNGDVYVGGSFQEAVNSDGSVVTVNNIVRWNAANNKWENLGQGIGGVVTAILVSTNQDVYVGGNLFEGTNQDGTTVPLNYIGRWNDSQNIWIPVGDGVDGGVNDIDITSGGEVVVSGEFTNAFNSAGSSLTANGIAYWNGSGWGTYGQGLQPLASAGSLTSEVVVDASGNIIVAGYIDAAYNNNGTSVLGPIVCWDGSQWKSLVNGLTVIHPVSGLAADISGAIYMLHYANEQGLMVVSALTGNNWTTIAELTGINRFYTISSNLSYGNTYLYAGGRFNEFDDPINNITSTNANNTWWNGTIWKQFNQAGTTGEVYSLELDNVMIPEKLYAGGSFSSISGIPANNIALFDGQNWQELGNGVNGSVHTIKAISGPWDGVFVGGSFSEAGNPDGSVVSVSNLAFWDESIQQWFNVGGFDGPVYALENFGSIILYAGGDFSQGTSGISLNNIARFNLTSQTWQAMGDGVGGTVVPNPVVRDIKLNAPNYGRGSVFIHLYVGGNFSYADQPDGAREVCRNIMLWDEVEDRWYSLGYGTDDEVLSLAIPRFQLGDLWVGGRFRTAVNRNGSFVSDLPYAAIWNGFEWHKLGRGVNGPVHTIELQHSGNSGRAFLAGEFTEAANSDGSVKTVNHIAVFERTKFSGAAAGEWETLGDGTDNTVYSLESVWPCNIDQEVVYAGGEFFTAGQWIVRGLAKWKAKHPVKSYGGSSVIVSSSSRNSSGQQRRYRGVIDAGFINCGNGLGKVLVDEIVFDDLGFREASMLSNIPYLQPFSLTLYDVENTAQPIAVYDSLTISSDNPQLLVIVGVDDTAAYVPNPDNISTIESILLKELVLTFEPDEVPVVFVHAVTDAPSLDIVSSDGDTMIVDLQYGSASTTISLLPGSYNINLLRSSDKQQLGTYSFILEDESNEYNVVTLSGFLNPAANQNGPALNADVYNILIDTSATSVKESKREIRGFALHQNYPNPFNPATTIKWQSPVSGWQTIKIYDLLGREIATIVNEKKPSGKYEVIFNAAGLSSGVYFYRLTVTPIDVRARNFVETKKLILMK